MKRIYFFTGLPCSGKSYMARLISTNVFAGNCTSISTGDIARQLMTTPELKDKTSADDLFPLEQLLLDELTKRVEAAPNHPIIVDGFPRHASQSDYIIDNFWVYQPKVFEINVGDTVTLFNRAKLRGRDDDLVDFGARLAKGQKNLSGALAVLNQRLVTCYTLSGGDDASIIKTFKRYTK